MLYCGLIGRGEYLTFIIMGRPKLRTFFAGVLRALHVMKIFRVLRHPHYIQFFGGVFWVFWQTFQKKFPLGLLVHILGPGPKYLQYGVFAVFKRTYTWEFADCFYVIYVLDWGFGNSP